MKRFSLLLLTISLFLVSDRQLSAQPATAQKATAQKAAAASATPSIAEQDWTMWRGPAQSGISFETNLPEKWNPKGGPGSNLLWKSEELAGRSTPIVMNGRIYTITRADPETPREGEQIVCADATTGKVLWRNRFNVYLSDVPKTRVGWSSCVGDPETGNIYALGVCGYFQCINGETGKTIWSRSLHEEYGLLSTYGGRTNFPILHDDLVIISAVVIGWGDTPATGLMAKPAHRFMAFDKKSGEMVWFNGTRLIPYDTTYSTPTLTNLKGQDAMIFGSGDGQVWAMQPSTGKQIWNFPLSRRGLFVSPLVVGETVYMGHSEENISGTRMGAFVAIDGSGEGDISDQQLWKNHEVMVGRASPIMVTPDEKTEHIYAMENGGALFIFDAKTGKRVQRKSMGGAMFSSPIYADGKVYLGTIRYWYCLQPTTKGMKVKNRMKWPRGESMIAAPIVCNGRMYITTNGHMYCVSADAENAAGSVEAPKTGLAPLVSSRQFNDPYALPKKPGQIQVVPCESLLKPGEKQPLTLRFFDKLGNRIAQDGQPDVTYEVLGAGTVDDQGVYTAPDDGKHSTAIITAKIGEMVGKARVRVVPPLPWSWDFNDDQDVPLTWVGGRVRYILRDVDGERVMVKRDNIPTRPKLVPGKDGQPDKMEMQFTKLGTRSRLWMGQPELANYTMQADVLGTVKDNKMPDIGLMNQRYTLELQGASQKLQIRAWGTVLRMANTVDFPWKPDTWYTMKITTEPDGDKLRVLGKVWPRGEEEPAEWTVEATDESPNLQGSPGLFGNTKDTEFYIDNLSVTPN